MEPSLLAMEHDQELLRIILKNMSYSEILDFCNTNQRFRGLCSDPETIVGKYLRQKRKEEVVAVVETEHDVAHQGFYITKLTLLSNRGRTVLHLSPTHPDRVSRLIQSVDRKEAGDHLWNPHNYDFSTQFRTDLKEYVGIYLYISDRRSPYMEIFVDPKLLKAILETALMGYDRNIEFNRYEILADYTARSPSIVF